MYDFFFSSGTIKGLQKNAKEAQPAKYVCSNTAEAEHSVGSSDLISLASSSIPVTCTFHPVFNSHATPFKIEAQRFTQCGQIQVVNNYKWPTFPSNAIHHKKIWQNYFKTKYKSPVLTVLNLHWYIYLYKTNKQKKPHNTQSKQTCDLAKQMLTIYQKNHEFFDLLKVKLRSLFLKQNQKQPQ